MPRESIASLYRRWRHTRGFGVHSPFAYRIVKEVVRPPYGYVYHAEMRPRMTPIGCMLYRLSVFLRMEGFPAVEIIPAVDSPSDSSKRATQLERWSATHNAPLFILAPSATERESVEATLSDTSHGLLLSGRRYLIAIPREEMVFTRYDIL